MNIQDTYQFLKPSIDQYNDEEKKELCRLIMNEPKALSVQRKRVSAKEKTIAEMKRELS